MVNPIEEVIKIKHTTYLVIKHYIKNIKCHLLEQAVLRAICTQAKVQGL